jgi:hypothetical protein
VDATERRRKPFGNRGVSANLRRTTAFGAGVRRLRSGHHRGAFFRWLDADGVDEARTAVTEEFYRRLEAALRATPDAAAAHHVTADPPSTAGLTSTSP